MYLYDRKLSLFLLELSSFKCQIISIFAIVIKKIAVHEALTKIGIFMFKINHTIVCFVRFKCIYMRLTFYCKSKYIANKVSEIRLYA